MKELEQLQRDLMQQALNDCGCCEGLAIQTPTEVVNPPGLAEIAYRVGTQVVLANRRCWFVSSSRL